MFDFCTNPDSGLPSRIGPPPFGTSLLVGATCSRCPVVGATTNDGINCACPPGTSEINGFCGVCPFRHELVGTTCQRCLEEQVYQGGQCVTCPSGLYRIVRASGATEMCDTCPPTGLPPSSWLLKNGVCSELIE